jgi:hypothetical protein
MKILKFITVVMCFFSLLLTTSCEEESAEEETEQSTPSSSSAAQMAGTWARNDGQANTYMKLNGNLAQTCNNNAITNGIFNASAPSATFVVSGVTYVFPLRMSGTKLIVRVPAQGNANHVDTEYIRSTTWPCGSGGSSGGGNTGGGGSGVTPTTGSLTVWTQINHSCGPITVTVSGQTGTVTSFYSGGTLSCEASGCANFTLPAGTYSVAAKCQNRTWTGTATVVAGGCFQLKLN